MRFKVRRDIPVPVWRQIYEHLRAEARSGTLAPDGKLPSAAHLAAELQVNRHTVRQALKRLEDDGLVDTKKGAGTFLAFRGIDYSISARTQFSAIVAAQGMVPTSRVLDVERGEAPREVMDTLRLAKRDRTVLIARLLMVNGIVVGTSRHYFAAARLPRIEETVTGSATLTQALKRLGIDQYYRRSTTVNAEMPTPQQARMLGQSVTRPVLKTCAVNVDPSGRPIEVGFASFSSDRVRLHFAD